MLIPMVLYAIGSESGMMMIPSFYAGGQFFHSKSERSPQGSCADLFSFKIISRDLQQSGLFKAVLSGGSRLPASHIVEGAVEEFFEWDLETKWNAVLSIGIILTAGDEPDASKRILFQKTYTAKKA